MGPRYRGPLQEFHPMRAFRSLAVLLLPLLLVLQTASLPAQTAAPAGATQAAAPLRPDQALPLDPAVRAGTLPNGLRFFIRRNARPAARVSLRLAVDAGSIQEEDDQRGLAHFVEHMAFNGTEHFKPGELVAFLESIGARFGPHVNASTNFDETIYMLDVPADRPGYVDRGLLALRDFAGGLSLLPEEIERERGVVLEEWRGRLGAQSRLQDQQLPVLLGGSRYAERLAIGTPEVLRSFAPERLRAFYTRWYRTDRMSVVVVGDVAPEAAEALVRQTFGDLPRPAAAAPEVDRRVPAHAETRYRIATDPEAQGWSVTVALKQPIEIERTVADYRRSLVRTLALEILNLRLEDLSRRPDAPFLGADAGSSPLGRAIRMTELGAAVPANGLGPGLEALLTEARRLVEHGVGAAELDRARQSTLAGYEQAWKERDTTESPRLASELVWHALQQEPVPGIGFEFQLAAQVVPGITIDEVSAAARALFGEGSRVVTGVAPAVPGTAPPAEEALRAAVATAASRPVTPWADATAGRTLVATAPTPGTVTGRRTIPELGLTILTFSNGVEAWLKPTDFKADQVLFTLSAPGGASLASREDFLEARLAPALVATGGLGGFSPVDLTRLLSGKIANATPDIGAYTHGVQGSASPRDLETALQLAYLVVTAPGMDDAAVALLKRRYASVLENQVRSPRFAFSAEVQRANTAGHYSAEPLSLEALTALDAEAMRRVYRERFANAADFTLFMVGTFTVDEVTPLLARWIGSLPSRGTRASAARDMGVRFPEGVKTSDVRKGREPASQTVMAFYADTRLDELAMHRLRAATTVLSMRLRERLREQLGGTYGVSVSYENSSPVPGYGLVTVAFGSAPEQADTLQAEVLAEVTRLQREGPSAEDVAKVQEMERRDLETSARQNSYWLGSLQSVQLLGWDPLGILRRGARTDALSVPLLQEAFRTYFPMDRRTVVTLRPETTAP